MLSPKDQFVLDNLKAQKAKLESAEEVDEEALALIEEKIAEFDVSEDMDVPSDEEPKAKKAKANKKK